MNNFINDFLHRLNLVHKANTKHYIVGMSIQSESDPSLTRSEENNPIRVQGNSIPTPTATLLSESELKTGPSWTLVKI